MATSYEAVVRFFVEGIDRDDDTSVGGRLRAAFHQPVKVQVGRVSGELAADIRLLIDGSDASEVQLRARQLCQAALEESGLADHVGDLVDVDVRTSS